MYVLTRSRLSPWRSIRALAAVLVLAGATLPVSASAQSARPPSVTIPAARSCGEVDRLASQHGLPPTNQLVVRRRAALGCDAPPPPPPPPPRPTPVSRPQISSIDSIGRQIAAARTCPELVQTMANLRMAAGDARGAGRRRSLCNDRNYRAALDTADNCTQLRAVARSFARDLDGPYGSERRRELCEAPPQQQTAQRPPRPAPPTPAQAPPPVVARSAPAPASAPAAVTASETRDGMAARGWAAWQNRQWSEGRTLLVNACDNGRGSAAACNSLGVTWDAEVGDRNYPRQPQQALEYFRYACDAGLAQACNNGRLVTSRGLDDHYDAVEAHDFFVKSRYRREDIDCAGTNAQQCLAQADGLSAVAVTDADRAAVHYWTERACAGGLAEACHDLADRIFFGKSVAADPADALVRWTALCDRQGYAPSCDWAAYAALYLSRPVAEVQGRAARACQDGIRENGCWVTALIHETGYGVPVDLFVAEQQLALSCLAFDAVGCRLHAEMHEGTAFPYPNPATARLQRGRACRLGDSISCARVAPDEAPRVQGR